MIRFEDLVEKVRGYSPDADVELLRRAYVFSAMQHKGQVRHSGEPYLVHPLEVADILADMRLDHVAVASGLLHDVVEDTLTTIEQKGEIQPVGGVNRKIEAFFDICRHKGLDGQQGVIIPAKNVANLMLKQEVVDAVKAGQFHVYPISTIEEGIEILTGLEAGTLQPDGSYPEGTLFRKVDDRLKAIAEIVKAFGKDDEGGGRKDDNGGCGCPACGH